MKKNSIPNQELKIAIMRDFILHFSEKATADGIRLYNCRYKFHKYPKKEYIREMAYFNVDMKKLKYSYHDLMKLDTTEFKYFHSYYNIQASLPYDRLVSIDFGGDMTCKFDNCTPIIEDKEAIYLMKNIPFCIWGYENITSPLIKYISEKSGRELTIKDMRSVFVGLFSEVFNADWDEIAEKIKNNK